VSSQPQEYDRFRKAARFYHREVAADRTSAHGAWFRAVRRRAIVAREAIACPQKIRDSILKSLLYSTVWRRRSQASAFAPESNHQSFPRKACPACPERSRREPVEGRESTAQKKEWVPAFAGTTECSCEFVPPSFPRRRESSAQAPPATSCLCYACGNVDWKNKLYFGDNLKILREYVADASVDLIYLDPPFNSSATYNVLFKEKTGEESAAQITAFEDGVVAPLYERRRRMSRAGATAVARNPPRHGVRIRLGRHDGQRGLISGHHPNAKAEARACLFDSGCGLLRFCCDNATDGQRDLE
jgi:hypothetical protein